MRGNGRPFSAPLDLSSPEPPENKQKTAEQAIKNFVLDVWTRLNLHLAEFVLVPPLSSPFYPFIEKLSELSSNPRCYFEGLLNWNSITISQVIAIYFV